MLASRFIHYTFQKNPLSRVSSSVKGHLVFPELSQNFHCMIIHQSLCTYIGVYLVQDLKGKVSKYGTQFLFSWTPPRIGTTLITGYNLTCVPQLAGIPVPPSLVLLPTATSANISGLFSGVSYNCSIFTLSTKELFSEFQLQYLTLTTPEAGIFLNQYNITYTKMTQFFYAPSINSSIRPSSDVNSSHRKKTSFVFLVSSAGHPAQWSPHQLHHLLLPLHLLPPPVPLPPPEHLYNSGWVLSQHSLHLLRDCLEHSGLWTSCIHHLHHC